MGFGEKHIMASAVGNKVASNRSCLGHQELY